MSKTIYKKTLRLCFTLVFSCLPIFTHASNLDERKAPEILSHELTPFDLEAFFDDVIPLQIDQADVAGMVISVVKDGTCLFSKGYGYADTVNKIEISPEKTIFRPGSISKLFIWTAIMQQVEQGKLDLDEDINKYLDFKIPPAFEKPMTLRDIMTQRSGFEETFKDIIVASTDDLQPLSEYLQLHMPRRIFPPGTTPAYSNYATTMAAYIVERVSGQNFNDYVEEHIFKPLEMNNSTFNQPLPDRLKTSMSNGYKLGSSEPKPFELFQIAPAGALSTSAVDMTHFMIMHLQNGLYRSAQLLKPETILKMHARQDGWPKSMNAMCLGFYEKSQNGYRIIGHEGHTVLFHSNLFLNLDANTGVFISYNSAGQSKLDLSALLFDKFMDRYYPQIISKEMEKKSETSNFEDIVGTYVPSRRFETTFLAVSKLFLQFQITANLEDTTISMTGFNGMNGTPIHFQEIEPMVFQEVDGKAKIAFVKDTNGQNVVHANYDVYYPSLVFQQLNNMLDSQGFNYLILGFSLSVILLTLLAWPVTAMLRKRYKKPTLISSNEKKLQRGVHLACISITFYVIGLLVFASTLSDLTMLSGKNDLWLRLLQVIALSIGLSTLGVIYYTMKCWLDKEQWFWNKIWNTFVSFACIGFFWFIYHWNLLSIDLKY